MRATQRQARAMAVWALAWPSVRTRLGLKPNCCVHAALGASRAASLLGLSMHASACRTIILSPSTNRMVEYGVTDGVGYLGGIREPDGYGHHAVVLGDAGFADLALDAHQLAPGPLAADWGSVTTDLAISVLADFAPNAVEGDAWAMSGQAPPGAFVGAGEAIIALWELIDEPLTTQQPDVVEAIGNALADVARKAGV